MAKKLRGWDAYVKEAETSKKYEPIEFMLGKRKVTVPYPTRAAQKEITNAGYVGDVDAQVCALFGEKTGNELIKLADPLPMGILDNLVLDALAAFGLTDPRQDEGEAGDEAGKATTTSSEESPTE